MLLARPRRLKKLGKRRRSARTERPAGGRDTLFRFLAFARPYRWWIALIVLAGVTRFALQFATPWGIGVLLDGALKHVDRLPAFARGPRVHQIHWVALILTAALVLRCFAQYAESLLTSRLGNRLVFDLRRRLYAH